jgi:type I restriction enzyme S subunit
MARIAGLGRHALVSNVALSDVKELNINVPGISEQRRIAAILDQVNDLRRKRRRALKLMGHLLTSSFLELFGDPVTNSAAYPLRELKSLGRVATGSTPPSSKDGMFGGPIPFVTPGDLESEEPVKRTLTRAGARASKTVEVGSALVCCIGATIGKMAIAQRECAFNQQINAVEWDKEIEPHYGINVLQFLRRKIAEDGASTTLPILKKSLFERITIPAPPISLQRDFSGRVAEIDTLKAHQRAHLVKLDARFASLQHRAFLGEL